MLECWDKIPRKEARTTTMTTFKDIPSKTVWTSNQDKEDKEDNFKEIGQVKRTRYHSINHKYN
jgi:hypothetical protein